MAYWVYVVVCVDGSYYTGIATDVDRRIREHNGVKGTGLKGPGSKGRGARYTAARRPVALVHREAAASRSLALRRELEIKRMTRVQKERLISSAPPDRADRIAATVVE